MALLGDFHWEFGKFGMWASVGYKRHPTDFCGASVLAIVETSCVFGKLFRFLFFGIL